MNSKAKQKTYNNKKYMRWKQYTLGVDEKGFLCSCNSHEKECIRECYIILNRYADKLLETVKVGTSVGHTPNDVLSMQTNDNLEDELQKEIADLKACNDIVSSKQFQVVDSGAKNFIFVRTTMKDPVSLASTIAKDIFESQQLQTRYLIRLVPIEATCKAYINNIKRTCSQLLERHFKERARSFSIIYNHRNNKNLSRTLVIKEVADLVHQIREDHIVDLNNADVSIVIEVIKSIALLSVIPNYLKYKKFNLHTICNLESKSEICLEKDIKVTEKP